MAINTNEIIKRKAAIILGISGMLGSIILFAGDMLFYYRGEHTDKIANMAHTSPERIVASAICALVAAWLYTLAAGQIYYAFKPEKTWIRRTVFITFGMIMISYGVIHGAYVAIATSARNAAATGMSPEKLTALAVAANQTLRKLVYVPFAIFTLLFMAGVWKKRTLFPRWMVLFSPIIPFLFKNVVTKNLEGQLKIIIGGGYLNLILLLFFAASTTAIYLNPENTDIR
jgi:hypothetical protein